MTNPFERDDISYLVLVNEERQYSLWPESMDVPVGWRAVFGPETREVSLSYIDREWTDIRPARLVAE